MTNLGTIHKNGPTEIRFAVENLDGCEIVSAAIWVRNAEGDYRPGGTELAFPLELLGAVLVALGEAGKAVPQ